MHFEMKELNGTSAECRECPRAARFRIRLDEIYCFACYRHAQEFARRVYLAIEQMIDG